MRYIEFIEENTQKGYTLKINTAKKTFLVFDRKGGSVYADSAGSKIIHKVPVVVFLGNSFKIHSRINNDYALYKVSRKKIVLPYSVRGNRDRRYILLDTDEKIDMLPVKVEVASTLQDLIKLLETGFVPDAIIVDEEITSNDIVVIKNREKNANIIVAESNTRAGIVNQHRIEDRDKNKDEELISQEFNINIMSQNPVFLARLHLRQHDIVKVKQLLLDFDLSTIDAEYILTFINAMMKQESNKEGRSYANLKELYNNFDFYKIVMSRDDNEVKEKINNINNERDLSNYRTIIAKARSMVDSYEDQMLFTEYENILFEQNEKIKDGESEENKTPQDDESLTPVEEGESAIDTDEESTESVTEEPEEVQLAEEKSEGDSEETPEEPEEGGEVNQSVEPEAEETLENDSPAEPFSGEVSLDDLASMDETTPLDDIVSDGGDVKDIPAADNSAEEDSLEKGVTIADEE